MIKISFLSNLGETDNPNNDVELPSTGKDHQLATGSESKPLNPPGLAFEICCNLGPNNILN